MKKIPLRLIIWTVYMMIVAGGALGSMRIVANATSSENLQGAQEVARASHDYYEKWYELDDGKLVLKLENHIPGYTWKLGSSNDSLLKTVDYYYDSYSDRIIILAPASGESGEVILTAACMKDIKSKPIDRRQLRVRIAADGQMALTEVR